MEKLELDIAVALRSYELAVRLSAGAETVALVGPSGAGKTTVLRAVAGLRRPGRGRIALGERVWFDAAGGVDVAPERRAVGLVFQEYALFPHLSVRDNVAFGARGADGVGPLLDRLGIAHLAGVRPAAISGGERQRVALARALAREPDVLLLDEPLSALDAQTRATVRAELQDVLAALGIPALLVTHDFADASALADRVGVLVEGRLRQLAPPAELVRAPADAFVAGLTGANVLHGEARGTEVTLADGTVVRCATPARGPVALAIHPWEVAVHREAPPGPNVLAGIVAAITPSGDRAEVRLGPLLAECPADAASALRRGAPAYATFAPESARVL